MHEPVGLAGGDEGVSHRGETFVLAVVQYGDMRGPFGVIFHHAFEHLHTAVGRAVIAEDVLEVGVCLFKHASGATLDIVFYLIDRYEDGNPGFDCL